LDRSTPILPTRSWPRWPRARPWLSVGANRILWQAETILGTQLSDVRPRVRDPVIGFSWLKMDDESGASVLKWGEVRVWRRMFRRRMFKRIYWSSGIFSCYVVNLNFHSSGVNPPASWRSASADLAPWTWLACGVKAKFREQDHEFSYRRSYQILPRISRCLGNQVSVQGAAWRDACSVAWDHPSDVRGIGRSDRQRCALNGPRAYVRLDPSEFGAFDRDGRVKGSSSRRIPIEYPELRKWYRGRRFWARGYFSTTSGNVTDDVIVQYLELHSNEKLPALAGSSSVSMFSNKCRG